MTVVALAVIFSSSGTLYDDYVRVQSVFGLDCSKTSKNDED